MDRSADVVVHGLPYRLKSGADHEEAEKAWSEAINRYFRNHDEGVGEPLRRMVIPVNAVRWVSDHELRQMKELGLDVDRVIPGQALINAYCKLKREHDELQGRMRGLEK
ncbi:MAG: hypothetical protein EPO32_14630 [Anaerolineae bacterium]|nr:MAG: hypothetical protein EPO32_14630 [Anaerolineae bacterium]